MSAASLPLVSPSTAPPTTVTRPPPEGASDGSTGPDTPAPAVSPRPAASSPPLVLRPPLLQVRCLPAPVPLERLEARQILLGALGYVMLPLVGVMGHGGGEVSAALAPPVAALFLSVPSLLTGHQFLSLHASPADLVRDIAHVFVGCGKLALGLVPMVALYSATSAMGPMGLVVCLVAIGLAGVELSRRRLVRREGLAARTAGTETAKNQLQMDVLAVAWAGLALLIGARMGLELIVALVD